MEVKLIYREVSVLTGWSGTCRTCSGDFFFYPSKLYFRRGGCFFPLVSRELSVTFSVSVTDGEWILARNPLRTEEKNIQTVQSFFEINTVGFYKFR